MSAVTSAAPLRAEGTFISAVPRLLASAAAALSILGVSVALLLTPVFTHWALDAAGSDSFTGHDMSVVYDVSDRTVAELLVGPGTFGRSEACSPGTRVGAPDFYQCFYGADEAAHLRDARSVLYGFGILVLASGAALAVAFARARDRASLWQSIGRGAAGLAIGFVVLGAFFLAAFDAAFTLFHQIFFPGGNWSFDPRTQRLVQLYPIPFWQLTSAVLGVLAVTGGAVVAVLARARARAAERAA